MPSRPPAIRADDIDWFVPHQANKRIIDDSAHKLGIAPEKVVMHGRPARQHVGGLDPARARVAVADGRIKRGDLVMLEAMGGGFTWGAGAGALVTRRLRADLAASATR